MAEKVEKNFAFLESGELSLFVSTTQLSPKQKQVLQSGVSVTSLFKANFGDAEQRLRCSIKYDPWDEVFQVASPSFAEPSVLVAQNLEQLAGLCFRLKISRRAHRGEVFKLVLEIDQNSPEQAEKVKQDLIKQQIFEGFLNHWIGDLNPAARSEFQIVLPRSRRGESSQR